MNIRMLRKTLYNTTQEHDRLWTTTARVGVLPAGLGLLAQGITTSLSTYLTTRPPLDMKVLLTGVPNAMAGVVLCLIWMSGFFLQKVMCPAQDGLLCGHNVQRFKMRRLPAKPGEEDWSCTICIARKAEQRRRQIELD